MFINALEDDSFLPINKDQKIFSSFRIYLLT